MKTYLCGGIQGLNDSQCHNWRETAKKLLNTETLDPMVRDYRGQEDTKFIEIVELDLKDIEEADFLLINACRPSWGTASEMIYAHQWEKPCVAFANSVPGEYVSPWLQYHCRIFFSLEDACNHINFLAKPSAETFHTAGNAEHIGLVMPFI
jgi:nucleoside 2-deoxyribosyltransferase